LAAYVRKELAYDCGPPVDNRPRCGKLSLLAAAEVVEVGDVVAVEAGGVDVVDVVEVAGVDVVVVVEPVDVVADAAVEALPDVAAVSAAVVVVADVLLDVVAFADEPDSSAPPQPASAIPTVPSATIRAIRPGPTPRLANSIQTPEI
jgi:hypothetical protein